MKDGDTGPGESLRGVDSRTGTSSAACAIPHVLIKQDTETSHGAIAPVAASTSAPVAPSHGTEAQGGAGSSPPATQAAVTPRKRTVHCSVCGSAGHNRSKCPSAPPPPPSPTPIPGLPGLALRDVGLCLETALEQAKALLSAAGMGQGAAEEELGSVEGRVAGAVRSVVEAAEAVARVCASTRKLTGFPAEPGTLGDRLLPSLERCGGVLGGGGDSSKGGAAAERWPGRGPDGVVHEERGTQTVRMRGQAGRKRGGEEGGTKRVREGCGADKKATKRQRGASDAHVDNKGRGAGAAGSGGGGALPHAPSPPRPTSSGDSGTPLAARLGGWAGRGATGAGGEGAHREHGAVGEEAGVERGEEVESGGVGGRGEGGGAEEADTAQYVGAGAGSGGGGGGDPGRSGPGSPPSIVTGGAVGGEGGSNHEKAQEGGDEDDDVVIVEVGACGTKQAEAEGAGVGNVASPVSNAQGGEGRGGKQRGGGGSPDAAAARAESGNEAGTGVERQGPTAATPTAPHANTTPRPPPPRPAPPAHSPPSHASSPFDPRSARPRAPSTDPSPPQPRSFPAPPFSAAPHRPRPTFAEAVSRIQSTHARPAAPSPSRSPPSGPANPPPPPPPHNAPARPYTPAAAASAGQAGAGRPGLGPRPPLSESGGRGGAGGDVWEGVASAWRCSVGGAERQAQPSPPPRSFSLKSISDPWPCMEDIEAADSGWLRDFVSRAGRAHLLYSGMERAEVVRVAQSTLRAVHVDRILGPCKLLVGDEHARAVLQVPKGASSADVKAAFRRLSLLVHPDKNGDHPLAADAFAAAQGAFRALERRQA